MLVYLTCGDSYLLSISDILLNKTIKIIINNFMFVIEFIALEEFELAEFQINNDKLKINKQGSK